MYGSRIAEEFKALGWDLETEIPLGTGKSDYCDISKNSIFIEQEYSRFGFVVHCSNFIDEGVLSEEKWGCETLFTVFPAI